jgi:hypothetical protein
MKNNFPIPAYAAIPAADNTPTAVLYEDHIKEVYTWLHEMDQELARCYYGEVFEGIASYRAEDCLEYAGLAELLSWCSSQQETWIYVDPAHRKCAFAPTVAQTIHDMWNPAGICASL